MVSRLGTKAYSPSNPLTTLEECTLIGVLELNWMRAPLPWRFRMERTFTPAPVGLHLLPLFIFSVPWKLPGWCLLQMQFLGFAFPSSGLYYGRYSCFYFSRVFCSVYVGLYKEMRSRDPANTTSLFFTPLLTFSRRKVADHMGFITAMHFLVSLFPSADCFSTWPTPKAICSLSTISSGLRCGTRTLQST